MISVCMLTPFLQAAEALHAGLLSDAAAMKAMGTLVQAKTLRFDLSGSSTGMGMAMGGQMGAAGSAARPSTANPAAHARMQNMVRDIILPMWFASNDCGGTCCPLGGAGASSHDVYGPAIKPSFKHVAASHCKRASCLCALLAFAVPPPPSV